MDLLTLADVYLNRGLETDRKLWILCTVLTRAELV
jgi:hypothetical protein